MKDYKNFNMICKDDTYRLRYWCDAHTPFFSDCIVSTTSVNRRVIIIENK